MAYEVEVEDLRRSAKAARSAARQLAGTDPGAALTGATSAMPGGASVAAMQRVSTAWSTELEDWVKAAKGYARTLDTNATQYELDDDAARAAFGPAGRRG